MPLPGHQNGDTLSLVPPIGLPVLDMDESGWAGTIISNFSGMSRKSVFPFLLIVGTGVILTAPVLIYGIPFFSDDAVTHHAVWYIHFSEQLWSGDLYPRWLMAMNEGLGSPVFFYYPPVPFYVTSLLRPFFHSDSNGWYQLGLSASAALIASGLCAYVWLIQMVDRNPALAAAVLYMSTPYHLASDLYVRGSLSEYWAFIWMPLILFFTHKIAKGDRLAVAGFAVSYALLVMTHLPMTLIFSPIPICYALCLAGPRQKLRLTYLILTAMTLGSGLSFIYLWPAMTTQHFVFLERMSTGYFSYKNWLFLRNFSLWRDEKILVLLTSANLAAIACCAFIIARVNQNDVTRQLNAFWFGVAGVGILMMTQLSEPIWMFFSVLRRIQFPWRFNAIVCVATTVLLALALSSIKDRDSASIKILSAVVLLLIIGWIPGTIWAVWQAYPFHKLDQEEINYKNREISENREVPEYYPRWNVAMAEMDWESSVDENEWDGQLNRKFEALVQRIGESGGRLSKVKIVEGTGDVNVVSWKPGEICLQIDTPTGMQLNVSQFYYPNWTAQLASDSSSLNILPSYPDGVISLLIPRGEHQVLLHFERSSAEIVGQIISLISLVILMAYLLIHKLQSTRVRSK